MDINNKNFCQQSAGEQIILPSDRQLRDLIQSPCFQKKVKKQKTVQQDKVSLFFILFEYDKNSCKLLSKQSTINPERIWCYTKTDTKIKYYWFESSRFASGCHSKVFKGVKINGKYFDQMHCLKPKIVKISIDRNRPNYLLSEAQELDNLLKEGPIPGIQKSFDVLQRLNSKSKWTTYLVNDRYEGSLNNILLISPPLNFETKLNMVQQLASAIQTLQMRKFFATDIKSANVVWKSKDQGYEVVHIDVGAKSHDQLVEQIETYSIRAPVRTITAACSHNQDLQRLSTAVAKKDVREYLNVVQKLMVYQLGVVFFSLFTNETIIQSSKDDLSFYKIGEENSHFLGTCVSQEYIHERLKKIQRIEMRALLSLMLNPDCQERIDIDQSCIYLHDLSSVSINVLQEPLSSLPSLTSSSSLLDAEDLLASDNHVSNQNKRKTESVTEETLISNKKTKKTLYVHHSN